MSTPLPLAPAPVAASSSAATAARAPLTRRELHAWGVGSVGETVMIQSVGALIMPIFNTGFGMSAVLVSWAITIPRIFDAITDPIVGHWSDSTRSRWGRRRPFLFAGAISCALLTVAVWWPSMAWPEWAQFAYLLSISMLFWFAFTLFAIPLQALGMEITDDYEERNRVATMRVFYCTVPALFMSWIYWLALRPAFGGEVQGIRWVSVPLALIVLVSGLLPAIHCKERVLRRVEAPFGLFKGIALTFRNRQFLHLMLVRVLLTLGTTIFGGMVFYINAYHVCGGDKALATQIAGLAGTMFVLLMLGLTPVFSKIAGRYDKRTGLMLGIGCLLLNSIVQPFIATPAAPYLQLVALSFAAPGWILAGIFTTSLMADLCDVDELRTGQRREGIYSAVGSFITKLEVSVCTLMVGGLIAWSGFDPKAAAQTTEVTLHLRIYAYVPFFVFTAAALWLASRFKLTRGRMAEVRAELNKRATAVRTPVEGGA